MGSDLGRAAAWYAGRGWRVLPLKERSKIPAIPGWTHEATTDVERVEHWWATWPLANVGVACGPGSGVWVLDVDGAEGAESLDGLVREHGQLPDTPCQVTGGGGQQFFFKWPEGVILANRVKIRPGLDVRVDGGQVVVPPSIHPKTGRAYAWDLRPDEYDLAEAPGWLLDLVQGAKPGSADPAPLGGLPAGTTPPSVIRRAKAYLASLPPAISGQNGHAAAYRAASALVWGFALEPEEARVLFVEHYNPRCTPEWDGKEIDHKITEAFAKEHEKPRGYLLKAGASGREQLADPKQAGAGERQDYAAGTDPFTKAEHERDGGTPPRAAGPGEGPGTQGDGLPEFPLNDLGNALRLVHVFGQEIRYCHTWGEWLVWSGTHWQRDQVSQMMLLAEQAIATTCDEQLGVLKERVEDARAAYKKADDDQKAKHLPVLERAEKAVKAMAEWKKKSLSRRPLENCIEMAKARTEIAVVLDQLDQHKYLFSVANGIIDLRTAALTEHNRDLLVTRHCPIAYDPTATDERWAGLLEHLTQGDGELLAWLQRSIGVSMTSDVRDQKIFVLSGPGGTGKSTFIDGVCRVLGSYSKKVPFDLFLAKNSDRKPWVIADCAKVRLVLSEESDEGARIASSMLKELSGGTVISVEPKNRQPFEYRPGFKIWLVTNNLPHLSDTDSGMWRRLQVARFDKIPGKSDPTLKPHIEESETAGRAILAWMVQGAAAWWTAGGVGSCAHVEANGRAYRDEQNPILPFLEAKIFFSQEEADILTNEDLWSVYRQWSLDNGVKHLVSHKSMHKRLVEMGFTQTRAHKQGGKGSVRVWAGLRLRQDNDTDDEGMPPRLGGTHPAPGSVPGRSETTDEAPAATSETPETVRIGSSGTDPVHIGEQCVPVANPMQGHGDTPTRYGGTGEIPRAHVREGLSSPLHSKGGEEVYRKNEPPIPPAPWTQPPDTPMTRADKLRRPPDDSENIFPDDEPTPNEP